MQIYRNFKSWKLWLLILLIGFILLVVILERPKKVRDQNLGSSKSTDISLSISPKVSAVKSFVFAEESDHIAVLDQEETQKQLRIRKYDTQNNWKMVDEQNLDKKSDIYDPSWSPKGNYLIFNTPSNEKNVFWQTGFKIETKNLPEGISKIKFLQDHQIIYAYKDRNISQMNLDTGQWSVVVDNLQDLSDFVINKDLIFLARNIEGDVPEEVQVLNLKNLSEVKNFPFRAFSVLPSTDNSWIAFNDFEPPLELKDALQTFLFNTKTNQKLTVAGDFSNFKWLNDIKFETLYQENEQADLQIISYQIDNNQAVKNKTYQIPNFKYSDIKQISWQLANLKVYILNKNGQLFEVNLQEK